MFTPRLVRPEAGNKYYIRICSGGYSTAIEGRPTDEACDVLHNCVGYAVGRFHEIAGRTKFDLIDPVNAENLYENAKKHGLQVGQTPKLGALIVWQKGPTQSGSDGAGHVAVVEEIGIGGEIRTSESGYGAAKPFWCGDYKPPYAYKDGYRLLGFVYQPMSGRALRKGDKGAEVELMQSRLCERGYLRKTEIDGSFGRITLGAVLCFQFEHGLAVDGVCGPKTQAALTE